MAPENVTDARLTQAIEGLRTEFQAGLSTAGVQIGAVEKTLIAKLSSMKAWGVAALVGGQALAGLLASLVGPHQVSEPVRSAVGVVVSVLPH